MKKCTAIILSILLTFTAVYAYFNDIDGHWAQDYIDWAYNNGIINGYPDGTFKADETITRAECIKILSSLYDIQSEKCEFEDVNENDWYYEYVKKAHGVMPKSDGKFYPNTAVTRQDAIYALITAKFDNNYETARLHNYNDGYLIEDYAKDKIAYAVSLGIICGYPDNTLKPNGSLTRGEFTKMLKIAQDIKETEQPPAEDKTDEKQEIISNFIRVKSVETAVAESGATVKIINGTNVTLTTIESFDTDLKNGDTIIPTINHKNEVQSCLVLATAENGTVKFNKSAMDKANSTYKRTQYYYGEIKNIERGKFVTLTDNKYFAVPADATVYFYDFAVRSSNKLYSEFLDILSFDDGEIYNGNDSVNKAYIVAREYDGTVNEVTVYLF